MWSWFRPVRFAAGKLCREAQRAWQRSELPMAPGRPVRPASCRRSAARPAAEEQAQVTHCCTGGCRSTSPSERGRLSSSSSLAEWQPGGSGGRGCGGDEQCQRHEAAARRCFGRAGHGLKSVQGGVRLRWNQVCCCLDGQPKARPLNSAVQLLPSGCTDGDCKLQLTCLQQCQGGCAASCHCSCRRGARRALPATPGFLIHLSWGRQVTLSRPRHRPYHCSAH